MKTKLVIVLTLSLVMISGSLLAQIDPPSEPVIIVGDTLMVFPIYNKVAFDALNKWIDYGFSLETLQYILKRPFREISTRFHLKHPWWIPVKFLGEMRALLLAIKLYKRGPRFIQMKEGTL